MGRAARWLGALLVLLTATPATAAFYEGTAIVTGTGEAGRDAALRTGLREVLARAAGMPDLLGDSRVDQVAMPPILQGFAYVDRMGDLPRHDEQGSRDRPYLLHSFWNPAGIDAALAQLGAGRWPLEARPPVVVRVTVTPRSGPAFTLAPDTDVDERHRAALLDAANRWGLTIRVGPSPSGQAQPGTAALTGTLEWSEGEGWRAAWSLDWENRSREVSRVSGVSFDAAYRDGLGGAAGQMALYWRNR